MAIELKFSKPDAGSHWGFRLVGGADFNEPLVVVKVDKNSFAENAGLMVGDVVVRVNDTPTAGLTHAVAHDLIFDAGNEFIVAIRRGLFSDIPVPTEDDINSEIENILKESLAEQLEGIKKETRVTPSPVLENLSGQEQLVQPQKGDKVTGGKKKKWSTFLVKPKNPVPKAQAVPVQKIAEPYKVKIVKQPRRDPKDVLNHKKTVKFEPNVVEVEISRESSIASMTESSESIDLPLPSEIEMETSVKIIEETTVEICEEGNDDFDTLRSDSSNEISSPEHKSTPILKPKPIDIHIEPVVCESSQSLAEQLAAVQKQLLLLSQLPSAIQVTLEAVTEQLNKIALDKLSTIDENENCEENVDNVCDKSSGEEDAAEENLTESENAEHDITENGIEDEDQPNLEEFEVDEAINEESAMPDVNRAEEMKTDVEETREAEVIDPYAGLTEEEKEAKIREEQLLAKKQKVNHWNRIWPWGNKEKPIYSSRESNCCMVPSKVQHKIHQFLEVPASGKESRLSSEVGSVSSNSRHGTPVERSGSPI
ncbi:uncharacterized protein LOC126745561 isoform X2 [Anthonomus grandis grandis]|uniref:uncharacterized protein LOC126745561 isoform X2 n=1 Tax=Anthonomus grandis grandis TaxID=2921223 RepID=UPI002165FDD3|nr:uncharacterized protein LOC126745561 isoform X2 [Anthonomus grandis grandis]